MLDRNLPALATMPVAVRCAGRDLLPAGVAQNRRNFPAVARMLPGRAGSPQARYESPPAVISPSR